MLKHNDDADCEKYCVMMEVDVSGQDFHLRKIWWDCVKEGMKSLGLSPEDAQYRCKMEKENKKISLVSYNFFSVIQSWVNC